MAASAGAAYLRMPPVVPLWYSRASAEAVLAPWWMIGVIPLIMNGFLLFNMVFVRRGFVGHAFIEPLIRVSNIALTISFTLIFLKIISLAVL